MADYRIIDADGHVMELDSELREFIGPPYNDLEWHQSYSFWPGPNHGRLSPLAAQERRLGRRRHRAECPRLAATFSTSTRSS